MHIIQIVRNYLGLTQAQLAKASGLSQADVCEMEKKPPYWAGGKVSAAVGVSGDFRSCAGNQRLCAGSSFVLRETSRCTLFRAGV